MEKDLGIRKVRELDFLLADELEPLLDLLYLKKNTVRDNKPVL